MKAIRGADGGVVIDHLDAPPGTGELIDMRSTSVCASDLMYIGYGLKRILGHELAGVRADGTPVVVGKLSGRPFSARTARNAKACASISSIDQPTFSAVTVSMPVRLASMRSSVAL